MQGQLFTSDFLRDGICGTPAWKQLDTPVIDAFIKALNAHFLRASISSWR